MRPRLTILTCLAVLVPAGAVGCGGSSQTPAPLAISISEAGGEASFKAPKSTEGGLVEIKFENKGKAPHSVQLALLKGDHSIEEGLKIIQGNSPKTPEWLRA